MTDVETIRRLQEDMRKLSELYADMDNWRRRLDVDRATEAARWAQASSDIGEIKDELQHQSKDQAERHKEQIKRYNWILGLVLTPLFGLAMNFALSGGFKLVP